MALNKTEIAQASMATETGELGRPDGFGSWEVPPALALTGKALSWGRGRGAHVTGRTKMLEAFARLSTKSDEDILRFARAWGVLGICAQHSLPRSHFPNRYFQWLNDGVEPCRIANGPKFGYSEPLSAWREYSAKAAAVLNIAAKLNDPNPQKAAPAMWTPLLDLGPKGLIAGVIGGDLLPERRRKVAPVEVQRDVLAAVAVQGWLDLGDVEVQFTWSGSRPHFDLGSSGLFGAIGMQLALAVARRDGLALCDECGEFFIPKRQGQPGAPRRCPKKECREDAAKRESARRRRARERGELG